MRKLRKKPAVYIICSLLVAGLLTLIPMISQAHGSAVGVSEPGSDAPRDPLHRLPSSPEEAHRRLAEREISWPEHAPEGDFRAAGVQAGSLRITIPYDTVEGFITTPEGNVKVELFQSDGVTLKQSVTKAAGADGWFKVDLSTGDIVSGDKVKVTDLAAGAPVTVDCTLTGTLDFSNDRVSGTTASGNQVTAYIVAPSTYYADVPPGLAQAQASAGPAGSFILDFTGLDLRAGDAALVFAADAAGNTVMNVASGSGTALVVYPQYDEVLGYYVPGTSLTVSVDGHSRNATTLGDGFFETWFSDYDVKDGDVVSCNMGGARSITVRDVSAKCDPALNRVEGTAPGNRAIRVTMDPYGTPVVYETQSDASGNFIVNLGTKYSASGTDVYNVTWYDGDGDAVVYEFQTFSWYLAEGCTLGDNFDTFVLVQNPGTEDAEITMTFQLTQGTAPHFYFVLGPGQRRSVWLDKLPGLENAEVSTKVTSLRGNWVVAERAVYFNFFGKQGGHDSIGALTPAMEWYLAEGCTLGDNFDTFVL
ncbi:hypothetical protein, partial [Candidatus Solincola tengchongensis]|uniref:hypothetical protein n=1 Tax=Candidatus Solincola tengchongensis TaxID=2900693 RepID=UPI00257CD930